MSGGAPDESDDKQHEPSRKRLEDARKRGEVPRSVDLTTAAAYGGVLLAGTALGPGMMKALGTTLSAPLDRAAALSNELFSGSAGPIYGGLIGAVAKSLWPIMLIPAALALTSVLAQQSLVFAPSKLAPKLNRISPISGLKNKFGRAGLFEFGKSFAKLLLYSAVLSLYLTQQMPRLVGLLRLDPRQIIAELGALCLGLIGIVLVVALALGVLDLLFQHAEHVRKNRMSRKELTDETRESEGDPQLKQQRRQKGMDIATNRMLADVPKADVVIVNPTHYAVALTWNRAQSGAPRCVAKGVDSVAARIREIAAESAVPTRSDPPTARALHATVEIGQEIPPDHYRAVAAAIRFSERIRRRARAK